MIFASKLRLQLERQAQKERLGAAKAGGFWIQRLRDYFSIGPLPLAIESD